MTLVLLHGFTGAPASWDAVRAHLPASVEVIAVPLTGHALETSVDPGSFDGELDRLARRIAPLGPVSLVGYSLGARLALGLCIRHPQQVKSALLVGVAPGLDASDRARRVADDARWIALLENQGVDRFAAAWEAQPLFAAVQQSPRDRGIRRGHSAAGLGLALARLGLGAMPDFRPHWPACAVPITLVVGERDAKFVALARELVAARRQTRLSIVPGCGHALLAEAPLAIAQMITEGEADGFTARL